MDAAGLVTHPLRHPYKRTPQPNGKFDWLPILSVRLSHGAQMTSPFEAIVDSGAYDCLFHADIAAAIGIEDVTTGIERVSGGVVKGVEMRTYGHEIRLVVGADIFTIIAYFSADLPIAGLLGRHGFFDNYIVTFDPTGTEPGIDLTRTHSR